jgi:hypothetical protein
MKRFKGYPYSKYFFVNPPPLVVSHLGGFITKKADIACTKIYSSEANEAHCFSSMQDY